MGVTRGALHIAVPLVLLLWAGGAIIFLWNPDTELQRLRPLALEATPRELAAVGAQAVRKGAFERIQKLRRGNSELGHAVQIADVPRFEPQVQQQPNSAEPRAPPLAPLLAPPLAPQALQPPPPLPPPPLLPPPPPPPLPPSLPQALISQSGVNATPAAPLWMPAAPPSELANVNVHAFYYAWCPFPHSAVAPRRPSPVFLCLSPRRARLLLSVSELRRYGSPAWSPDKNASGWVHWNHEFIPHWDKRVAARWPKGKHDPDKKDIGSDFFPALGEPRVSLELYDSWSLLAVSFVVCHGCDASSWAASRQRTCVCYRSLRVRRSCGNGCALRHGTGSGNRRSGIVVVSAGQGG